MITDDILSDVPGLPKFAYLIPYFNEVYINIVLMLKLLSSTNKLG